MHIKLNLNDVVCFRSPVDDGKFKLHIFDEIHHRDYTVYHSGTKKVLDVKQDMFNKSDIPVGQQIWSGWPPSCTNDDLTLGQLGLNTPQHDLSFRAAPVMVSQGRFDKKKRYSRVSIYFISSSALPLGFINI